MSPRGYLNLIRLGRVLHVSANRNIIVKIEKIPKIGDVVFDENLKSVGNVFDIFGPVSAPYASVKPKVKSPETLVNKVLYVSTGKKAGRI